MVGALLTGMAEGANFLYGQTNAEKAAGIREKAAGDAAKVWSDYEDWAKNNTGAMAAQGAYNMAKDKTGTLTSSTSQSQAYAAQNAQENAGVNKSQAAMSGQNAAAASADSMYNDQFGSNLEAATNAIEAEGEARKSAAQKEHDAIINQAEMEASNLEGRNLFVDAAQQVASDVKDIAKSVTSWDYWFGSTSDEAKEKQNRQALDQFYQSMRKSNIVDYTQKQIQKGVSWNNLNDYNRQKFGVFYQQNGQGNNWGSAEQLYNTLLSIYSDENAKHFEKASLKDCLNMLFDTIEHVAACSDEYTPGVYTPQEQQIIMAAIDFINLVKEISHVHKLRLE